MEGERGVVVTNEETAAAVVNELQSENVGRKRLPTSVTVRETIVIRYDTMRY